MIEQEQERERPVGLKTLAAHLNLSPATISVVLNSASSLHTIAPKTQARVLAAAKQFNYKPNRLARSLRTRQTFNIGIIVPGFSEGYFTMVMSGVEEYLLAAGYMHTVVSHQGSSRLMLEHPRELIDRAVDGILLVNTTLQEPASVPVVCISGHEDVSGVTNVMINHDTAAFLVLEHLQSLGHSRIAFMRGPANIADSRFRWNSIGMAAKALGISMSKDLCIELGDQSSSPEVGFPPVRALLERTRDFTAICCFNDLSAIGAIRALADAGLRCPEDVSVVGFDDVASAAYQTPRLTTVAQPLRQMGETAAKALVERLRNPAGSFEKTIIFEPTFVTRESAGPVPKRG